MNRNTDPLVVLLAVIGALALIAVMGMLFMAGTMKTLSC